MGWGSGSGKKEVLNAAVGDPVICGSDEPHPFDGKLVFIDLSGLAHRASKKDPVAVVREGTSLAQQDYVRKQIASVAAEGGTPVLVLDGRAYPPKLATRALRRDAADAARSEAEQLQQDGKADEARSKWAAAARPQEPFWLALLHECLRNKVQFVVAPYEADAQLVSLAEEYGDRAIIWASMRAPAAQRAPRCSAVRRRICGHSSRSLPAVSAEDRGAARLQRSRRPLVWSLVAAA